MTDQDTKELFRVLGNMPKFREWVAQREKTNNRFLKQAIEPHMFHKAQGVAQILDEISTAMDRQVS